MKNLLLIITVTISTIIFSGCPLIKPNPKYHDGVFPDYPTNFLKINSAYDDYNSALPIIQHNQHLIFSSNRNSLGQEFDIVGDNLNIWWDMESGLLTVDNTQDYYDINFIDTLLKRINTPFNEFGPYALKYWINDSINNYLRYDILTYSTTDEQNNYKSKFAYFKTTNELTGTYHGPFSIKMTETLNDAQYISFLNTGIIEDHKEFNPSDFSQMILNVNDNGNVGIYSIELPPNDNFIDMLKDDSGTAPTIIPILNSSSQDKCPFVNKHFMVFTSNRPGGFGGYDLYYSWFINGVWEEPTNFGAGINTEYDEFRPVTIGVYGFVNDLMIFSSNRPGGKGGFDLYYVGLPFKIQNLITINE